MEEAEDVVIELELQMYSKLQYMAAMNSCSVDDLVESFISDYILRRQSSYGMIEN